MSCIIRLQNNPEDKMERHLAKQKTWEAELKRQFKPMKPIAIGCIWDDQMPAILKQLEACCLLAEGSIDPTYMKKEYQEHVNSSPSTTSHCSTAMPVPEEGKSSSLLRDGFTGYAPLPAPVKGAAGAPILTLEKGCGLPS
jgi:hypothetical protein